MTVCRCWPRRYRRGAPGAPPRRRIAAFILFVVLPRREQSQKHRSRPKFGALCATVPVVELVERATQKRVNHLGGHSGHHQAKAVVDPPRRNVLLADQEHQGGGAAAPTGPTLYDAFQKAKGAFGSRERARKRGGAGEAAPTGEPSCSYAQRAISV